MVSFDCHVVQNCGIVSLFIFLEKTKQKIVSTLESLHFQGRSWRQNTRCVIKSNCLRVGGDCYRTIYNCIQYNACWKMLLQKHPILLFLSTDNINLIWINKLLFLIRTQSIPSYHGRIIGAIF